jgi:hypothetical protein
MAQQRMLKVYDAGKVEERGKGFTIGKAAAQPHLDSENS